MSQKLTYTRIGDYYYPNLYLPTSNIDRPLGKYGMLRKTYLKQHCPVAYEIMLMGGTSLLIMVGVDLDTMSQIEGHLKMHHQEGLVKKGKIRSRNL